MAKIKISESQVPDAVMAGDFAFQPGTDISVISPEGQSGTVKAEDLKEALQNGYKYEDSFNKSVRETASKSSGFVGGLRTFAAQAADEALMGLPETGYDKLADPFDIAVKDSIKKDHEVANALGGLTGFGASLLYGGPIAKVMGMGAKAGLAAERIVATNLAKQGITRGSESLAKQILARTAENATKLGVEGAVVASPIFAGQTHLETIAAIKEDRLANYDAAAESLMLGGGLGLAFGVVSGPTGALFNKLGKSVNKMAESQAENAGLISKTVKTAPNEQAGASGALLDVAESEGMDEGLISKLKTEIGKTKSNVDDIVQATKDIGIEPTEGMLSDSIAVQRYEAALAKKASFGGIKKAEAYQKIYQGLEEATKKALNVADFDMSRAEVGLQVKGAFVKKAQENIDKLGAVFNELRMDYKQIPVDLKPLRQVSGNIKRLAKSAFDSDSRSTLKNVASFIDDGNVNTLDDLMNLRTELYKQYGPNQAKNHMIGNVIKKINTQEEMVIDRAIKSRIDAAKVPGAQTLDDATRLQQLYDDMQVAKKDWAELAGHLEETADDLSLGNIKNPRDFVRKMGELTPEQVVAKMAPKNDVTSMQKLAEKFPEQFGLVSSLQKARLLEKARVNDQFSIRKFISSFRDMEPEAKRAILGDDAVNILNKVRTVEQSIPRDINPSGTASAISWTFGNIPDLVRSGIMEGGAEYAIKKAMNIEGILGVESRMGAVSKALDRVSTWFGPATRAASPTSNAKKSIGAITQLQSEQTDESKQERFKRISEQLGDMAANPESAIDSYSKHLEVLQESGAPNVADALGRKVVGTVQYLYDALPKSPAAPNPFNRYEFQPSDRDLAAFERKLSVAIDPFVALDAFEDGTLTNDHVDALAKVYPEIHNSIRKKILDYASGDQSKMTYADRMKMSLLLGLDLDQSILPSYVNAYQNSFSVAQTEQQSAGLGENGLKGLKVKDQYETSMQRLQT